MGYRLNLQPGTFYTNSSMLSHSEIYAPNAACLSSNVRTYKLSGYCTSNLYSVYKSSANSCNSNLNSEDSKTSL